MWYGAYTLVDPLPPKTKSGRATRYEYDARAVSVVGVAYRCTSCWFLFSLAVHQVSAPNGLSQ